MSNCDSDGCPVDHDGSKLEDGVFNSCAPFAVRGDVLREIFSGSCKDVSGAHLDAHPLEGTWVRPSSLGGGIPVVERVEIEDLGEGYDSDEPLSPKSAAELCKNETSATVHAVLRTNKQERDALISTRRKLADALDFLRSQGYKEEQIFDKQRLDGFGPRIPERDDFGLPKISRKDSPVVMNVDQIHVVGASLDPFKDKMKSKIGEREASNVADKLIDEMPQPAKEVPTVKDGGSVKPSWAEVINKKSTEKLVVFDYKPMASGSKVVSPPKEVLLKGNDKLKCSLVGLFSKGYLPLKKVADFAFSTWKKFGLQHVSQKDERTFIFRFADVDGMHSVLATGTWYLEKRPLLVHRWGSPPGSIQHMPLWVRFDRVPDSYWTQEGLSYLSSAIGKPLTADELTRKLEIVPFAKMCVDYNIGDDLPSKIEVEVLDPLTGNVNIQEVLVSYPHRPNVCTGCKSLGHLVGACPIVTRQWVVKKRPHCEHAAQVHIKHDSAVNSSEPHATDGTPETPVKSSAEEDWQTVKKKPRQKSLETSPATESPPPQTLSRT